MKIQSKIMSGYALITLLFIALSVIGIRMVSNVRTNFHTIESETVPVILTVTQIYGCGLRMLATAMEEKPVSLQVEVSSDTETVRPLSSESDSVLLSYTEAKIEFEKRVRSYEEMVAKYFLNERFYVDQIHTVTSRMVSLSDAFVAKQSQHPSESEILALKGLLRKSEGDFTKIVDKILDHESDEIHERSDYTNFLFTATIRLLTFSSIIILLAALTIGFIISRNITHPIDKLLHAATEIANGNYHTRVSINNNNEVGNLANTFNSMMSKIERYNSDLQDMVDKQTAQLMETNRSLLDEIQNHQKVRKEMQQLENQLLDSQKMEAIGTLAGGIAHDFNNILTAQLGYTDLCLLDAEPNSPLSRRLSEIKKAGMRATELTRQILTFSRQNNLEMAPVQLKSILREVTKLIRSTIPTTIAIKSKISQDSQNALVMGEATRFHQIIMNLCTNAYHAMREKGGTLTISLDVVNFDFCDSGTTSDHFHSGNYLKLSVQDTGPGMEPHIKERIFDPYFTTKKREEGTGLGLSVVHGIVKRFAGKIEVESEPGKGATFNIYLPLIQTDSEVYQESITKPILKGCERILFVDDEEIIVQMQEELLQNIGYKVTARTSSIEALQLFEAHPDSFDIVITDMSMPNMNGATLAKKILHIRPDIPVILCTGFSDTIDEKKAREIGITEFLLKPLILKKMALTIRHIFDAQQTDSPDQMIIR